MMYNNGQPNLVWSQFYWCRNAHRSQWTWGSVSCLSKIITNLRHHFHKTHTSFEFVAFELNKHFRTSTMNAIGKPRIRLYSQTRRTNTMGKTCRPKGILKKSTMHWTDFLHFIHFSPTNYTTITANMIMKLFKQIPNEPSILLFDLILLVILPKL